MQLELPLPPTMLTMAGAVRRRGRQLAESSCCHCSSRRGSRGRTPTIRMMWYVPPLPPVVTQSSSQIGIITDLALQVLGRDRVLDLLGAVVAGVGVDVDREVGELDRRRVGDLFLAVLVRVEVEDHERAAAATCTGGRCTPVRSGARSDRPGSGLLIRHGSSTTMVLPGPSQLAMLTGKTTGRTTPPVRAPVTAVAAADAVNWLIPIDPRECRAECLAPADLDALGVGGIVDVAIAAGPTCAAADWVVVVTARRRRAARRTGSCSSRRTSRGRWPSAIRSIAARTSASTSVPPLSRLARTVAPALATESAAFWAIRWWA